MTSPSSGRRASYKMGKGELERHINGAISEEIEVPTERRKSLLVSAKNMLLGTPLEDTERKNSLISPFAKTIGKQNTINILDNQEDEKEKAKKDKERARKVMANKKLQEKLRQGRGLQILNSRLLQVPIVFATFVALFCPDIFLLLTDSSWELTLEILLFAALILFLVELVLSFMFKEEYKWSFFFWLDLVALVSLVPDIPFLWEWAIPADTSGTNQSNLSILRAGRLMRTGTRTTRALRLLKFVRFVRIIRLFRLIRIYRGHLEQKYLSKYNQEEVVEHAPNKLGVRLADHLGKRVIIGSILMLLLLPLLEVQIVDYSSQNGVDLINVLVNFDDRDLHAENITYPAGKDSPLEIALDTFVEQHKDLILLYVSNHSFYAKPFTGIRPRLISTVQSSNEEVIAQFDDTRTEREQAVLNITLTCLLTCMLATSAFLFNRDVHENVVKPIIKTTKVIRKLAKTLFLLTNDTEAGSEEEELLEGNFINNIVDQLVTFFDVEPKPAKVAPSREPTQKKVVPAPQEIGPDGSAYYRSLEDVPDSEITVLDSFPQMYADRQALQYFKVFLTSEFAVESLLFCEALETYRALWDEVCKCHWDIIRKFVHERASFQVNINDKQRRDLLDFDGKTFARALYDDAFNEMFKQLQRDNFPRFKKSLLADEIIGMKKKELFDESETRRLAAIEESKAAKSKAASSETPGVSRIVKMMTAKVKFNVKRSQGDSTASSASSAHESSHESPNDVNK